MQEHHRLAFQYEQNTGDAVFQLDTNFPDVAAQMAYLWHAQRPSKLNRLDDVRNIAPGDHRVVGVVDHLIDDGIQTVAGIG